MAVKTRGVVNRELITEICSLAYDYMSRTARLHLPDHCCTDMTGAITFCRRIDPRVKRIETYSGDRLDITYLRRGTPKESRWVAVHPDGFSRQPEGVSI